MISCQLPSLLPLSFSLMKIESECPWSKLSFDSKFNTLATSFLACTMSRLCKRHALNVLLPRFYIFYFFLNTQEFLFLYQQPGTNQLNKDSISEGGSQGTRVALSAGSRFGNLETFVTSSALCWTDRELLTREPGNHRRVLPQGGWGFP